MRKKEEKGGEIERKWKRGSGKEEVKNRRDTVESGWERKKRKGER